LDPNLAHGIAVEFRRAVDLGCEQQASHEGWPFRSDETVGHGAKLVLQSIAHAKSSSAGAAS